MEPLSSARYRPDSPPKNIIVIFAYLYTPYKCSNNMEKDSLKQLQKQLSKAEKAYKKAQKIRKALKKSYKQALTEESTCQFNWQALKQQLEAARKPPTSEPTPATESAPATKAPRSPKPKVETPTDAAPKTPRSPKPKAETPAAAAPKTQRAPKAKTTPKPKAPAAPKVRTTPKAPAGASPAQLRDLPGLGARIEALLNQAGVQELSQLLNVTEEGWAAIRREAGPRFRNLDPTRWIEAARAAGAPAPANKKRGK